MPRKAQWPPPVRPHKSGQAYCRIRGVNHYLGKFGSPEVQAKYLELLQQHQAGGLPAPSPPRPAPHAPTVDDVVRRWLADECPRYAPEGGEPKAFRSSLAPLLALYRSLPAEQFDQEKLDEVRKSMASGAWMSDERRRAMEKKRRQVRWSERVINRRVTRIKTVWRWAERRGLVPRGSWAALRLLPAISPADARVRRVPRRKPARWEDVEAACAKLEGRVSARRVRTMELLQWWSGMRSGEVRIMRPCDIDRSGDVWLYRPSKHKNAWRGHERVVPLGPQCQALLGPLLKGRGRPDRWLFPGRPATRPIGKESYPQCVRRACLRAGVEPFAPYQLRHSFKRRVVREGGLDLARAMMGQKSVESTQEYDREIDTTHAVDGAARLA